MSDRIGIFDRVLETLERLAGRIVAIEARPAARDGRDGVHGRDGPPGRDGERGLQGARGEPGLAGAQGADGTQGAQGEPGAQGERGEMGLQGARGEQGPAGSDGAPGRDGEPGLMGPPGAITPIEPLVLEHVARAVAAHDMLPAALAEQVASAARLLHELPPITVRDALPARVTRIERDENGALVPIYAEPQS